MKRQTLTHNARLVEVDDAEASVVVSHKVLGLEVVVNQALGVQVVHAGHQAVEDVPGTPKAKCYRKCHPATSVRLLSSKLAGINMSDHLQQQDLATS